ncbi:MAG: thioredoxin [Clostridia bacterium]|nr:thioredoxin [Clostridia bacterium]
MSVVYVTNENFESEVLSSKKPVLIDFFATWCGPCHMISPVIEEIAIEHSEYNVVKIDVDKAPELAEKFGVVSIPSLFVIKDGKITNSAVGVKPKAQILQMLE